MEQQEEEKTETYWVISSGKQKYVWGQNNWHFPVLNSSSRGRTEVGNSVRVDFNLRVLDLRAYLFISEWFVVVVLLDWFGFPHQGWARGTMASVLTETSIVGILASENR